MQVIYMDFFKIKYITSKKIPAGCKQWLLGPQAPHRERCVLHGCLQFGVFQGEALH